MLTSLAAAGRKRLAEPRCRCAFVLGLLLAALLPGAARADDADQEPVWEIGIDSEVFSRGANAATRLGGWTDLSYENSSRPGQSHSLNVNHFNVFADTRFGEAWQLFLEVEFEYQPDVETYVDEREYEVEQIYLRYRPSDSVSARAGWFNTPFGIWNPIHWTILNDTIRPPPLISSEVIPEQQLGFEISGLIHRQDHSKPDAEFQYAIYLGYASEKRAVGGFDDRGLTFGADARVAFAGRYRVGVSAHEYRSSARRVPDVRLLGFYGELDLPGDWTLGGEYARQTRERVRGAVSETRGNLMHTKLRWNLSDDFYLNYRLELEKDIRPLYPGRHSVHRLTLGYRIEAGLRAKIEYASHRFRDSRQRGFGYWGASIGYLF